MLKISSLHHRGFPLIFAGVCNLAMMKQDFEGSEARLDEDCRAERRGNIEPNKALNLTGNRPALRPSYLSLTLMNTCVLDRGRQVSLDVRP